MNHSDRLHYGTLLRLLRYCKRYRVGIVLCILMTLLTTVISIFSPEIISDLLDTMIAGVTEEFDFAKVLRLCLWLAILYVVLAPVQYANKTLSDYIAQRTSYCLRRDISEKLTRLPISYLDSVRRGETLSRCTNDVDAMSDALTSNLSALISAVVLFVGVLWKMLATNARMTFVAMGLSLVGPVIMLIMAFFNQKYYTRAQRDLGNMTAQVEEVYNNHLVMSLFHARKLEHHRFGLINHRLYDSSWRSSSISVAMDPLVSVVSALSYTILLIMGCTLVLQDTPTMTFGELTAFLLYADMLASPISTLASSITSLQKTAAASSRVFELLDTKEQEDESDKPAAFPLQRGDITFDHVFFSYREDTPVIRDLDIHIKAGEKIALVGPSGVGKTTLVNLLMRFYEVDRGEIRIDGLPVRNYTRESVRALFDMVLQDTWLFDGTIRENLTFGEENVSDAQLDADCDAVGIGHMIRSLPKGYDTPLSELSGLSEGQRQQLTIVRMIRKNAPLLIFDEATSALDTGTEMQIQSVLQRHMADKTCLIIAHRLSTIRGVDRILVMQNGTVVESGNHEELMAQHGVYRGMYDLQQSGITDSDPET